MRVGVDARHLTAGRGVAHYTDEALAALAREFPGDVLRLFVPGRHSFDGIAARAAHDLEPVQLVRHRRGSRTLFGSAALVGRPRLERLLRDTADVLWIPAPAPVAIGPDVPYVLTVHDLSWLERPGDFTPYERLWHRLGRLERLAARAAVVVAVSGATRDALAARWPALEDVRVVHSGIPALPPPAPRPPWLPARYVLAVGALEPRKALDVLVRAMAEARTQGLDAEVVLAGSGRMARELRGPGVHVVDPDRATLAALYDHALALALPSRQEGFGFTPLEAARAGVPVVARDLRVLDETLGDAALRVTGDRWAEALLRIAGDEALRERLVRDGRAAAAGFSWAATARGLHAAFEDAAA